MPLASMIIHDFLEYTIFRNQRDGLGNKLLISLNICDLLICLISTVNVAVFIPIMNKLPDFLQELYYFLRGQNPKLGIMDVYKFFIWLEETTLPCYSLLLLFILMSCFITLLLSATRMISTVQPFLRMKQKFVLLAVITAAFLFAALFGAKLLVLACLSEFNSSITPDLGKMATCAEKHEPIEWYSLRIEWGLISSHVILVCIFNVVTILKLRSGDEAVHQADTAKRKRAATITVLILGLLFIVFNALWIALFICLSYDVILINLNHNNDPVIVYLEEIFTSKGDLITILLCLLIMPLNSALDPIVYMTRNSGMVAYRKQLNATTMWRTLSLSVSRNSVSRSFSSRWGSGRLGRDNSSSALAVINTFKDATAKGKSVETKTSQVTKI